MRLPLQQGLHVQMTLPATKQYRSDGLGNELLNAGRTCRLLNRTCIPWRGYAARGPHAQHIKPMFCAPLTIPKFQATRAILILEMIVKSLGALLLSALAASGAAFAVPVETRDVYSPKVLYPHSGTVWYSGQRHNVTWDNSNPPQNISNRAFIIMRQNNIEIPVVLAKDFSLRTGRVEVTVPDLITGYYSIVLFGDSGNWGDNFLINGVIP